MPRVSRRELHLPSYRIGTETIRAQWGGGASGVETKAVQAKDDDPTTLAVRVGQSVLGDRTDVDAVFFATTTPVYEYGSVTPFVVESLGLPDDTYVQTFGESARAGTAALRAATDAVAGPADAVLVVAAEAPSPAPNTDREMTASAGAAAVLVESGEGGLALETAASSTRPLLEEWQAPADDRPGTADDRFARDVGFVETTATAVTRALDDAGWATEDMDALVLSHPNGKFARRVAREVGATDALATPAIGSEFGDLRSAGAMASLALAHLAAADAVVVAQYGAGTADALAWRAVDPPAPAADPGDGTDLDYVEYLDHVDQLE